MVMPLMALSDAADGWRWPSASQRGATHAHASNDDASDGSDGDVSDGSI